MADETKPFWHLDLSKITAFGWLLLLITIASIIGATLLLLLLLEVLGLRHNPANLGQKSWYEKAAVVIAVGVGCGVFEAGRRILARLGFRVTRP